MSARSTPALASGQAVVSIVIPTFNRHRTLPLVLPSYLSQSRVFEVLVIDDGSTPPISTTLPAEVAADPRLRIVRHHRSLGSSAARNTGILQARGDFILFGEDDLLLDDDHVATLLTERERLGADLICGKLLQQQEGEDLEAAQRRALENPPALFLQRMVLIDTSGIREPVELPFSHAIFLAPRDLLVERLFSTRIGGPSFMREDLDLQLRLRRDGYRLFATPAACCLHLAREFTWGSGTRLPQPFAIRAASAAVNTWQVVSEHAELLLPFFDAPSADALVRRAVSLAVLTELKRWSRFRFPRFNRLVIHVREWERRLKSLAT